MGLLNTITHYVAPRLLTIATKPSPNRKTRIEQLEPRRMFAGDTVAPDILLGGVYFEEATGDDTEGDILQVSFEGGAAGTTLDRIIIDLDKNGDGLTPGDAFYDIASGGLGSFDAVPLSVISSSGFQVDGISLQDGGTLLVFDVSGFDAGEVLEFSVDIDELQSFDPDTGDPLSNSLVEGLEFQFSKLVGEFSAPGYVDLSLSARYYDEFDARRDTAEQATALSLGLPDDRYELADNKIDRSAGAVAHIAQEALATISGYVYHDRSDDGIFDRDTEEPIAGVRMELLDENGNSLNRFTETNQDGYYGFIDLLAGKYGVREAEQPVPFLDGKDTAGTHGGTAGNDIIVGAMLELGDDGLEYNFGELLAGSIAGRVHVSPDETCDFDNPAIPLEGVRIELLDAQGNFIRFTETDNQGRYKFEGLAPGEYQVREITPATFGARTLFDGGERAGDAGGTVSDDRIANIQIGSDQHAVDYDFCEHLGASLSGFVYHDKSDEGNFDPNEDPIAGVELKLLREDGSDTGRRAVTDSRGFYEFTDLAPGKYTVMENQPAGWYDGIDTPGEFGDGIANQDDMIAMIMLNFGDHSPNNNFGELLGGSIAGRVHVSPDADCDFDDPTTTPIVGVEIDLLDANGNVLDTTTTADDGTYKFDNLEPGEYQVRERLPADSPYYDGGERAGTAGGVVSNDLVSGIVIGSEEDAINYDFCEHVGASLSGFVYHDRSDDGIFDTDEDPIAGVELKLLLGDGTDTGRRAFTDATGFYQFGGLDAGKYTVMEVQPAGWYDGKDTAGPVGDGITNQDDMIATIMLDYGEHSPENNFGELLGGSIAGRVHLSPDADCDFDDHTNNTPLAGVTIELLDADGNVIRTALTDAEGRYKFDDLAPGDYQVREVQPESFDGMRIFDGGERMGSAGGSLQDDHISGIVIGSEEDAVNYDFCEHVGAMLSGYVYHDRSDDGSFDPSEDPIAGVELKLLDGDGNDTGRRAITTANGFYKFRDLTPGKYTVMENQPEGWYDGKDTPGDFGDGIANQDDTIAMIMLDFGDNSEDNNFGELLGGSIAGRVHTDLDGDCELDENEAPISGVLIELLDADGNVIDSVRTDANGEYAFTDLAPGVYSVREQQPADYFEAGSRVGEGGGSKLTENLLADIVVGSDQHWVEYNFCETPPARLSGYVYIDGPPIISENDIVPEDVPEYRDGQRTGDDTPLEGILVELRNGISGDPIFGEQALPGYYPDGPITTRTNADGYYEFIGLPGGVYAVVEHQPVDLIDGLDTPGSLGGLSANVTIPASSLAANKHEDPVADQKRAIDAFRVRFGNDVLLRITVRIGENSIENNFSEVRQDRPVFPPPESPLPPPVNPPVAPPRIIVPNNPLPKLLPPTVDPDPIFGGSSQALGWTWHLSVVNGGQPRHVETDEAVMRMVASRLSESRWQELDLDQAEWKITDEDDHDRQKHSDRVRKFVFGETAGIPVSGDWDGDGKEEIGVFVEGYWFLDLNANGRWDSGDLWAQLGSEADLPVTGDWDGDGKTDIGIFGPAWPRDPHAIAQEPGLPDAENYPTPLAHKMKNVPPTIEDATSGARLLRQTVRGRGRADLIDHVFYYGVPGDTPIAGDWNGDGIRTIGVYRDGSWQLDTNGDGRISDGDESYTFGIAGDKPAVGDWNGDGIDDIGIFRAGTWFVDTNGNRELDARDAVFEMGGAGDQPIAGDWDGDGVDEPGVYGPHQAEPEVRISQKAG